SVALKNDGSLVFWGTMSTLGGANFPAGALNGLNGVKAIAANWNHTVALRDDGTVIDLSDYFPLNFYSFTKVPTGLSGATAISAGGGFGVAIIGSALMLPVNDKF